MTIPTSIATVLRQTVTLAQENDRDVPARDRMHDPDEYDAALAWLDELETVPDPDLDTGTYVETACTDPRPGDLFRPVTTPETEDDTTWKRFIDGEMTDSWDFVMAYADPETGVFEGMHITHDSNTIELVAMCRACEDEQATRDAEVTVDGVTIPGPVCASCAAEHGNPPTNDEA